MKRILIFNMLVIWGFVASAQQIDSIEYYRAEGYKARVADKYDQSIRHYGRIHLLRPADYDAKLALARLYYYKGDYQTSIDFYNKIYSQDTTDVEALFGFGKCYTMKGKLDKASHYLSNAIHYLPDYVPIYLALAKAYSWNGELDSAIAVYERALKYDDSNPELWAGLGRMHYWKSLPKSASKYYKKAISLDSANTEIRKEYENIAKQLKTNLRIQAQYIKEEEESYFIEALVQSYSLSKRVSDHWNLQAAVLLDHSNRDYTHDYGDTVRWFDNSMFKAMWISDKHVYSGYLAYTISDKKISAYGLSYNFRKRFNKKLKINNLLIADYSYFYYWNQMGRWSARDRFVMDYGRLGFRTNFMFGINDDAPIKKYHNQSDSMGKNPFVSYSVELSFTVLKRPKIKLGLSHSYMNFQYLSPKYYTPYSRLLTGGLIHVYYDLGKWYIYGQYNFNLGTEELYVPDEVSPETYNLSLLDVDNWSFRAETGYNFKNSALALGGSRFYNPYYQNVTAFIMYSFRF